MTPTELPPRIHPRPKRVLVGVLAIDRDEAIVDRVAESAGFLGTVCEHDILVITRAQDELSRAAWSARGVRIEVVEDYEIERRHNLWKVAEQRNLVCQRALSEGYDAALFVDSDVSFTPTVVADLFAASEHADVVVVPYRIRWSGQYTVGIIVAGKSQLLDARALPREPRYPRIQGGPMGCTLIRRSAMVVPFEPMQLGGTAGEDIGFFYKLLTEHPNLVVRTTAWPYFADHFY